MEYMITAAIVLAGNLFSGPRGSRQWEIVTALYGWCAAMASVAWFFSMIFGLDLWRNIFFIALAFSLSTALARDYEKILKPIIEKLMSRFKR